LRRLELRFRLFYFLAVSFRFLITFNFVSASDSELDPKVTLRVHAVGQGNCVSLEIRNKNATSSEFMLVDIGSTSFANEAAYRQFQTQSLSPPQESVAPEKQPKTPPSTPPSTPPPKKAPLPAPESVKKSSNWDETQEDKKVIAELKKTYLDEFIAKMRQMLKKEPQNKIEDEDSERIPPIHVKTVVITHPDADHCNKLMKLFFTEDDKIEFLIFGGLPSQYFSNQNDQQVFKTWLSLRLKTKTQIFFPAIQHEALTPKDPSDPLKEFFEKEKKEEFAPHTFSGAPSFKKLSLAKAFDFHKKITISLLSLNPLHNGAVGDVVRLADDEADANKESIVLKVEHGQSSVLLTGDATQATIRRIKHNYKNSDFLQSTALLASHHGSAEHGCNSEEWITLVAPEYVLISHGYNKKYGHPHAQSYENFKKSPRLVQVPAHHVLVGRGTKQTEDDYEGSLHTTCRAIYSTLNSGTLTLELLPTKLILTPEIVQSLKIEKETKKNVKIEEKTGEILLSVQKKQARRYKSLNSPTKDYSERKMKVNDSKEDEEASIVKPILTHAEKEETRITTLTSKKKRKANEADLESPSKEASKDRIKKMKKETSPQNKKKEKPK